MEGGSEMRSGHHLQGLLNTVFFFTEKSAIFFILSERRLKGNNLETVVILCYEPLVFSFSQQPKNTKAPSEGEQQRELESRKCPTSRRERENTAFSLHTSLLGYETGLYIITVHSHHDYTRHSIRNYTSLAIFSSSSQLS